MYKLLQILTLFSLSSCQATEKSLIAGLKTFQKEHREGLKSRSFNRVLKEKYPDYFKTGTPDEQQTKAGYHLAYDVFMEAIYDNVQKFASFKEVLEFVEEGIEYHLFLKSFNPGAIHPYGPLAIQKFLELKNSEFNPEPQKKGDSADALLL